jgi:hypothetical protein
MPMTGQQDGLEGSNMETRTLKAELLPCLLPPDLQRVTFVAESSGRLKNRFQIEPGISTTAARFSTASSITSMALCRVDAEIMLC